VTNCILWGNSDNWGTSQTAQIHNSDQYKVTLSVTFSCIQDGQSNDAEIQFGGITSGNIDTNPCFANPNNDDYHLKSQTGRWDPNSQSWIQDDVTSPCIDAGDPNSPIGDEPFPNGGRINMGAYGGTAEASKSYTSE
jgi:hypothetical protein